MAVLDSTKMMRNAGEDRQVVVVFASLELDESQPDMSRRKLLLLSVWSVLRSEAQLHKVLVYQPLLYFGTCQAEAHSRKWVVGLFLQKNRSVS